MGDPGGKCAASGQWGGGPFGWSESRSPLSSQQSLGGCWAPSRGVSPQLVPHTFPGLAESQAAPVHWKGHVHFQAPTFVL